MVTMALAIVAVLAASAAWGAAAPGNMNGLYTIANPAGQGVEFNSEYATRLGAEFFDVYSMPIESHYAQVYWTMMDPVPLDPAIVARFANKTMAIVGYEVDQVFRTPDGDKSVPLYWAYNHHYEAYLVGANSKLQQVTGNAMDNMGRNHGATTFWAPAPSLRNPDGTPDVQYFSEGNGGEFRKSLHGYPQGFAQLVYSPSHFNLQPMQIDTRNRDYDGPGYKAWTLPAESLAPQGASYSGLLECPCTTRIVKKWNTTYATTASGTCATAVASLDECVQAIASLATKPSSATQISNFSLPTGCLMAAEPDGSIAAVFNTRVTPVDCGASGKVIGHTVSLVNLTVLLDSTVQGGAVQITITGPNGVWFGVGFNAQAMADQPYTIIVDGAGNVTERKLGDHDSGVQLSPRQVTVVSNTVAGPVRTVVLRRAFKGISPSHYTFDPSVGTIPFINAYGSTPTLSFHKARTAASLSMASTGGNTCVCNMGTHGTINGLPFEHTCASEPTGDLLQQKNPTCFIQTYVGGQLCCKHGTILLDADQPVDNRTMQYNLKFRFWFQEYTRAAPPKPASHQDLQRFYFQTEAYASEYDIVQCPASTSRQDCVQEISARFQVHQMTGCKATDPTCYGRDVNLIYAGGHCHAPACISLELYNQDTGELLCRQLPVLGTGQAEQFDEVGYFSGIPPCLWGSSAEGLEPPMLLHWNTNLLSIKRNNNTVGHYGDMASWQMRGVFV